MRGIGGVGGAVFVVVLALFPHPGALAEERLTVSGSADGELRHGGHVTISITAVDPRGFRNVADVGVVLQLNGVPLEEIRYSVTNASLSVGRSESWVGTGDVSSGRFFRIRARDVTVTSGGNRLAVTARASVLDDIPQGATFRFAAENTGGDTASVIRRANVDQDGISLITIVLAAGAALLVGGFLGSRFSGHRRSGPSVYGVVARRLAEERGEHSRAGREASG